MTCILLPGNDPYFNLACEEYFLTSSGEDVLLLYVNSASVVVGRHQQLYAEINHAVLRHHAVLPARRITGGGAVFHDRGNLNFSFIATHHLPVNNFREKCTAAVVRALQKLGLPATAGKRHEISIREQKISGSASHVFHHRVIHHGTLLFSSDLDLLNAVLTPLPGYTGKAVSSVRSEVGNIVSYLPHLSFSAFKNEFVSCLQHDKVISLFRHLKWQEKNNIEKLQRCKYGTWEWIVGVSPSYELSRSVQTTKGKLSFTLKAEEGIIRSFCFVSSFLPLPATQSFALALTGKRLEWTTLEEAVSPFLEGIDKEKFLESLF